MLDVYGKPGEYREPVRPLNPLIFALRKRRYDLEISSERMAAKIGVSKATLRKWETGIHSPTLPLLLCWAEALRMSIQVFPNE
jgi:transcriptional regulator with XRE-family HTH domain